MPCLPIPRRAFLALAAITISACAGEPPTFEGTVQPVIANEAGARSHLRYQLTRADGHVVELRFDGQPDIPAGSRLRLWADPLATALVEREAFHVRAWEEIGPRPQPLIAEGPVTPRKVAVVLMNFENDKGQPATVEQVRTAIFNNPRSTKAFFKEQSYGFIDLQGKARPDGDVFGWITIPAQNTPCQASAWANAALAEGQKMGLDLSGYDHYIFMFPRTMGCMWAGLGQLGGRATWINGTSVQVIDHELGHNFRGMHASSYTCTDANNQRVPLSGTCTASEYGNPFDIMGRGLRHTNAYNKVRAGWMGPQNLHTITASGTYTIEPTGRGSNGVQALRTARDGTLFYYIEYRQPFGFDSFAAADPVSNGLLVYLATDTRTARNSLLLDMNPATTTFLDAPLGVGKTFADPDGRVRITLVDRTAERATVRLEFPGGGRPNPDAAPPIPARDAGLRDAGPPRDAGRSDLPVITEDNDEDASITPMPPPADAEAPAVTGGPVDAGVSSRGPSVDARVSAPPDEDDKPVRRSDAGGCGCRLGGQAGAPGGLGVLLMAAVFLRRRRLRR